MEARRRSVQFQGFTLIELLVVMAIVAILAGLLLPALAKAKEKAHSTACLSNVKQWGLAFWMYSDDHDDFFPYEGVGIGSIAAGNNLSAWYNTVPVYAGQPPLQDLYQGGSPPLPGGKSIFVCPSVRKSPGTLPTLTRPFFMYGFNNRLDPNGARRFKRADCVRPVETVTFTENSEANFPSTAGLYTPARHSLRANLAFVDGHVQGVHTNDYRRTRDEDEDSRLEWSRERRVYWYPYFGAPE